MGGEGRGCLFFVGGVGNVYMMKYSSQNRAVFSIVVSARAHVSARPLVEVCARTYLDSVNVCCV